MINEFCQSLWVTLCTWEQIWAPQASSAMGTNDSILCKWFQPDLNSVLRSHTPRIHSYTHSAGPCPHEFTIFYTVWCVYQLGWRTVGRRVWRILGYAGISYVSGQCAMWTLRVGGFIWFWLLRPKNFSVLQCKEEEKGSDSHGRDPEKTCRNPRGNRKEGTGVQLDVWTLASHRLVLLNGWFILIYTLSEEYLVLW